jgi:hypothetical protein
MRRVTKIDDYLPDVTITRDGKDFLIRAHTDAGEDFVEDIFHGTILMGEVPLDADYGIVVDGRKYQQTGFREWPERNGAKVVGPDDLDDDLFDEIENRELEVRVR